MTDKTSGPSAVETRIWPIPLPAASLYVGDVMHQRMKPVSHRFHYPVFSLLVDLDRLA
ncbi:MAG: hypothetical protein RIR97_1949, partial [Pseudomonadota bacterium]